MRVVGETRLEEYLRFSRLVQQVAECLHNQDWEKALEKTRELEAQLENKV